MGHELNNPVVTFVHVGHDRSRDLQPIKEQHDHWWHVDNTLLWTHSFFPPLLAHVLSAPISADFLHLHQLSAKWPFSQCLQMDSSFCRDPTQEVIWAARWVLSSAYVTCPSRLIPLYNYIHTRVTIYMQIYVFLNSKAFQMCNHFEVPIFQSGY